MADVSHLRDGRGPTPIVPDVGWSQALMLHCQIILRDHVFKAVIAEPVGDTTEAPAP